MKKILITGSAGLIGSEAARFFSARGYRIVGIDNDMRATYFGPDASSRWNLERLAGDLANKYAHHNVDIRDVGALEAIFKSDGPEIKAVIHTAAQPSHDWAARDVQTDFTVNANGTLNLLELTRKYCGKTPFIFTSTNKVYGDTPNRLPLIEQEKRWEIDESHAYRDGIDETMSIDQTKHSLFGASKVAADVLTQEYGRYFDMPTVCFRGGCLTGPNHSGTQLHGFLSYLMKCAMTGTPYTVFGYLGKQVRDNIHSYDLVRMFEEFIANPRCGEVYNAGGGRESNCSMIEAIEICEELIGKRMETRYSDDNRIGDHIWYISNLRKFREHYSRWQISYTVPDILREIHEANRTRWKQSAPVAARPVPASETPVRPASLRVLGVNVSRVDYESAVDAIIRAAKARESFGVTALAVHGVMEAHRDQDFAKLLNQFHLITPDGQPVRWALNLLGAKELKDRVYGPTLTLKICERAAAEKLPVFLYGSRSDVLDRLQANLTSKYPGLIIAGTQADRFRDATPDEDEADIRTINASGARILFVGRGCPRQEKWVAAHLGKINAAMIAVGAAFDFHAGTLKQAPKLMQDYGLEWAFRLVMEPHRLWRRYLILNPLFVMGFGRQLIKSKVA